MPDIKINMYIYIYTYIYIYILQGLYRDYIPHSIQYKTPRNCFGSMCAFQVSLGLDVGCSSG